MIKFKIINDLNEISHLVTDKPMFCDIETAKLYVDCRLIQVYQPEVDDMIYIIDTDIIDLEEVKNWLKTYWTIWQGCAYDFGTLNMTTDKFDDVLLLARNAYPEWREYKLDNIVSRLGYDYLYDGLDKKALQKQGFIKGAYLSQVQLKYSATDVYALSKIWEDFSIQKARDIFSYKVDILSIKHAMAFQQNGLIVHQPSVRKELDLVETKIDSYYTKLGGLNPNSPKQCKEALGTASTDKNTLIKLIANDNDLAEAIYIQRRQLRRRTFLNSYNFPKIYTRFNPSGAVTGRFTSSGGDLDRSINAQQITRDLQYIFHQPAIIDGVQTVVLHADFSTAELRAGCSIMQEPTMYEELKAGHDLHRLAALLAMPDKTLADITKADRQKGKAISFGLIFGMSADSFQEYAYVNYGVKFTAEECKIIKQKYNTKYQNIARYHNTKWQKYKSIPNETPTGRRCMANLGTDAINYATQGCIADTTKLSAHYINKEDSRANNYIFNIVHDAIYMRVPEVDVEYWAEVLVRNMKKGWTEMCKMPMLYYKDIPMPVEYEYILSDGTKICKEV